MTGIVATQISELVSVTTCRGPEKPAGYLPYIIIIQSSPAKSIKINGRDALERLLAALTDALDAVPSMEF